MGRYLLGRDKGNGFALEVKGEFRPEAVEAVPVAFKDQLHDGMLRCFLG